MLKTGTRMQSQVCDTQVVIVRSAESLDELRCGGALMVPIGATESTGGTPSPEFSDGTLY